jgi:hypothetical protein
MPRPKRSRPGRRTNFAANERVVEKLLCGDDWDFIDPSLGPSEIHVRGDAGALDRLRDIWEEAWAELGESLTRLWVFGPDAAPEIRTGGLNCIDAGPGHRPWGWWEFDAPEERQQGETEFAYLNRLDLLLPGERELVEAAGRDE